MSIDKYRHEVPLKPGVAEFLPFLKKKGIRMGIATSNGTGYGRQLCWILWISVPISVWWQLPVRWRQENRRRISI